MIAHGQIPTLTQVDAERSRRSFRMFVETFWPVVEPTPFVGGYHIDHKVLDWVSTVTWAGNVGTIPDRTGYFVPVSFAERGQ